MVLVALGLPQLRVPLISGLVFIFFIANEKKIKLNAILLSLISLFIYFIIQALLIQENIEAITFYQSLVMVILYIFFYWSVNSKKTYSINEIKKLSSFLFYFFLLLFIPLDRELGRFSGLYGNPNGTAHTAMFIVPLILIGLSRKRKIILIGALLFLIGITASRSALLALGTSTIVFFIVKKWREINFLGSVLVMSFVVLISWYAIDFVDYVKQYLALFLDEGNHLLYTGSNGRDEIWFLAKERFLENPIVGAGFDSSKFVIGNDHVLGTHNSYLEILLKGGVIGLSLMIIFILSIIKNMIKSNNLTKPYVYMGLAIVLSLSTNSSVFFVFNFYFYYFLILLAISQAYITTYSYES